MDASGAAPVVDADGHVLEPRDTWQAYIDPKFRDRAIRIATDDEGMENLLIDGQSLRAVRGVMGALGGIDQDKHDLLTLGRMTYEEGAPPASYDPDARVKVMDEEGIDIALLYPTLGICWEGIVQDPALATAYTRAYNRWLVDFCSVHPKRLKAVAHLSLLDPDGAVDEMKRARDAGCVGIYLSPDMQARGGRHLSDPAFAPFWSAAQDLDMPVGFHVVVRDRPFFRPWLRGGVADDLFGFAFLAIDVMAAFTQMMAAGMFEQYPRLKCTVLEAGSNWIAAWLDRLDHKYEVLARRMPFKEKPSTYFYRQCIISADPDESLTARMVEHLGADYFVWASDYPHIDASFGVVHELRERLAGLPEASRRKVMGENAVRFYNLN